MIPPIDTVLFDLGGTLFMHLPKSATERNLQIVHDRAAIELGSKSRPAPQIYHRLRADVEAEFAERSFFLHRALVAEAFERYALALSEPALASLTPMFCDAQRQTVIEQLQPRQELARTVQTLSGFGVALGIVSNIDDDVLLPLDTRWGLSEWCALVLSSEQAQSCKPDSAAFGQALEHLHADPASTLFVGDSLANDVRGAAALGMRTALLLPPELGASLSSLPSTEVKGATVVVRALDELLRSGLQFVPNQRP